MERGGQVDSNSNEAAPRAWRRVASARWTDITGWIRSGPVSAGAAAVVLALNLTLHLVSPAVPSSLLVSPEALSAGRWWTVLTSIVVTPTAGGAAVGALALLAAGIWAERRLGSARFSAFAVASHVLGVLAAAGVAWVISIVDAAWGRDLLPGLTGGVEPAVVGAALAASAGLGVMWRRRVWVFSIAFLLVALLVGGRFGDLVRILAAVAGAVLVIATGARVRVGRPVGSRSEVRTLVAAVLAGVSLALLVAMLSPHAVGPLAVTRADLAGTIPPPDQVSTICGDPNLVGECRRIQFLSRVNGIGPGVLAAAPVILQLVLANGLRAGRRAAWRGSVLLQAVIGLFAAGHLGVLLLHRQALRPHWGEAGFDAAGLPSARLVVPVLIPVVLLVLLALTRSQFGVRSRGGTVQMVAGSAAVAVGAGALVMLLGLAVPEQFATAPTFGGLLAEYAVRLAPAPALGMLAPALVPVGPVATFVVEWAPVIPWAAVVVLMARALTSERRSVSAERGEYKAAVRRYGAGTLGWIGTWQPNEWWFSPQGHGALAYRSVGGVDLVVSDPACRPEDLAALVSEFSAAASANGAIPAFYSAHQDVVDAASTLGWTHIRVAEETVLALDGLAFTGKKFQDVRTALNRAGKEGIEARWTTWAELPASSRDQLHAISEEWVADKALPEMGFTLGGLAELDDPEVRLLLAVDGEGTVHGVTSWMPVHRDGAVVGLTLDFMRRRTDGFRPVIEFLIGFAALHAQAEGLELLSLSGAPLAHAEPDEPEGAIDRILDIVGAAMEPVYGFRSLLAFKSKFGPEYRPMYLTVPDPGELAAVATAIGKAYLPDLAPHDLLRVIGTMRRERT